MKWTSNQLMDMPKRTKLSLLKQTTEGIGDVLFSHKLSFVWCFVCLQNHSDVREGESLWSFDEGILREEEKSHVINIRKDCCGKNVSFTEVGEILPGFGGVYQNI